MVEQLRPELRSGIPDNRQMLSNPRGGSNHEEAQCRRIRHSSAQIMVQLLQLAEKSTALVDVGDVVVDGFLGGRNVA